MSEAVLVAPPAAVLDDGPVIRMLSHDLANSLNTLLMNAELARLQLDRKNSVGVHEALDRLLGEGRRCGELLQAYRRFGAGITVHPRETCALGDLIEAAVAAQPLPMPATVHVGGESVRLRVDRAAMVAVFSELLRNALDAQALNVRIDVRRERAAMVIDIVDDGCGISAVAMEHVGEPGFSTRRDSGSGGFGLALALRQLQAHDGSLRIAPNAKGGTHVEVCLPRSLLAS
jgi:signal transduction histidine kinase